jgi:hypothetical protein
MSPIDACSGNFCALTCGNTLFTPCGASGAATFAVVAPLVVVFVVVLADAALLARAFATFAPVVAAALLFAFTADDPADVFAADVFAADVVVALPVVALLAFVENVSIDPATIRATIIAPRRARPRAPAPTVIAPRTGNKRSTACSLSHARARPRARHRVVDCRDDALACAVSI